MNLKRLRACNPGLVSEEMADLATSVPWALETKGQWAFIPILEPIITLAGLQCIAVGGLLFYKHVFHGLGSVASQLPLVVVAGLIFQWEPHDRFCTFVGLWCVLCPSDPLVVCYLDRNVQRCWSFFKPERCTGSPKRKTDAFSVHNVIFNLDTQVRNVSTRCSDQVTAFASFGVT